MKNKNLILKSIAILLLASISIAAELDVEIPSKNGKYLTQYKVQGNALHIEEEFKVSRRLSRFQNAKDQHNAMWSLVTELIPVEERTNIKEFIVSYGNADVGGYVYSLDDVSKRWALVLNLKSAYYDSYSEPDDEFTHTVIHEFFHIKSMNSSQLDPYNASCTNLLIDEGCAKSKSYVNQFYNKFWDVDYWSYEEEFVTDYASTNVIEDIAESFTLFVLQERPLGETTAEKKINFFYDYPELVALRENMRNAL